MIPIIPQSSLTIAKYTKLLKDVTPSILTEINEVFATFGDDTELQDHFYAKYRYYEICDDSEEVFKQCVFDVFHEYYDYYTQVLTAYKNDISFEDILSRTTTRTDTSSTSENGSVETEGANVHREYDLPNKVVSQQSEDGYLTSKDTDSASSSSSNESSRENEYSSDITNTDNREFVRLKQEYLKHIRDIYEEFTNKFEECFLHIY